VGVLLLTLVHVKGLFRNNETLFVLDCLKYRKILLAPFSLKNAKPDLEFTGKCAPVY